MSNPEGYDYEFAVAMMCELQRTERAAAGCGWIDDLNAWLWPWATGEGAQSTESEDAK